MDVRVFATPDTLQKGALDGKAAIVIDALRMTSVAATAMEHGCAGLLAVAEVEEARAAARQYGALLGGERGALKIEGFDFSNTPQEYTRPRIAGRRLVMTTSNGTRAILAAAGARRVLRGAVVNASAAARAVDGEAGVGIVCAGTLGAFTLEDALAAGAIVERLCQKTRAVRLDDMALAAHRLYRGARGDLAAALAETEHYGRLTRLGLEADLVYCLREDILGAVPERQADGWFR